MKNTLITIVAMAMIALCGCKTSQITVEESYKIGTAVGNTTAYVLNNQFDVSNSTKTVIIDVVTEISKYVPATNETCSSTWTPIVKSLTDGYVKEGRMTQNEADRVVKDFKYITTLLDKYIDKKGLRSYQELIDSFVHGFCDKFLEKFKNNVLLASSIENEELDEEAYEYLSKNISK